jgi:nucleotide-binding universal stress UspA family protein
MPQTHIHRILLATDFSPGSMAALPYAVAIARRFQSKLYLAHIIPIEAFSLVPLSERDPLLENVRAHVEEQMAGLRAMSLLNGIAHEVLIDHGDVWPMLSAMVEKQTVDLLVIGTQGRRGVEKLLLGSTAEEILRMSQKPVLMVGPESSVPPETELRLRRILHATDFSPESEPAMHYAYALAKEYGASLVILHVAEDVWQEPLSTRLKAEDFCRERVLERHWKIEEQGVVPEYRVEFGPRADCILDVAGKLQSELIVIGVRGARYPRVAAHLPGPTAYDVVSRSRCPVLVIRGGTQVQS